MYVIFHTYFVLFKSLLLEIIIILNIIVAEDDQDIANLHKLVLELRGHKITLALDGRKCVESYGRAPNQIDAILLDYRMPLMDGIQVAKRIIKLNSSQRIVMATAQSKETLSDSLKELGRLIETIEKPFEPDLLVQVIERKQIRK